MPASVLATPTLKEINSKIITTFEKNVQIVNDLINFDRIVLSTAITDLEKLSEKLKQHHKLDNPHLSVDKTLENLRNIQKNDSLRTHYGTIFNQALVLLVSHFASALSDVFVSSLTYGFQKKKLGHLKKEEMKLTFGELEKIIEVARKEILAEVFSSKKEISFQDMQSVYKAFKNYLHLTITKDVNVNNIIVSQACRHSIVHDGAIVNSKTLKQVEEVFPRNFKEQLVLDSEINLSLEEIMLIETSMMKYLERIIAGLNGEFLEVSV